MRLLVHYRRLWVVFVILIAGCTLNNVTVPSETISGVPTVRILSPLPNATYLEGVAVNIQATIANAGKDIDRVEVVIDGATVATLNQPNPNGAASFNITHGWSAAGDGSHSINVTAYRADGSSSAPATVQITVVAQNGQSNATLSIPAGATQSSGNTTQPTSAGSTQQTAPTQDNSQPTTNPPTAAPTTAPTPSHPTATFSQGINVRRGPSTLFDPPIGAFVAGQTTQILALNTDGTWYKVQFGGGEGWVFAALTTASGDVASLPRDPGPPIPTPAPPTAVPATQPPPPPATSANLVAGIIVLNPSNPVCAQTFTVGFDVANLGNQPTSASGTVSLVDVRNADGSQQGTTVGGFPVLQPQQTFRVNMPLTISTWYNEGHTITLTIDPSNQIPETTDGDNQKQIQYTLQKGSCP